MAEHRKFMRFLVDLEIEVTDPTAAAAYTMDFRRDDEGNIAMAPYPTVEDQMQGTLSRVLSAALVQGGAEAGFKYLSASVLPRFLAEGGEKYTQVTLPEMPARRDDGTFPDID
ncbi:hypothetical protein ACFQHV_00905 [Promicromonospora thailandica]|uniref:Uncharacterized protein n=1 Tax=Promicromonospora thailandica TaxID=765201 RepID=A0A9X2G5A5_9MICO|nr:hypothetical protein [Promicromonospora thailandica]MCP2265587.1 hypothetical protein [Promicromonospora thailandica]BFF17148.1 hypothetical protein GCM10025730_06690 [Promicromonospora thailandica]